MQLRSIIRGHLRPIHIDTTDGLGGRPTRGCCRKGRPPTAARDEDYRLNVPERAASPAAVR